MCGLTFVIPMANPADVVPFAARIRSTDAYVYIDQLHARLLSSGTNGRKRERKRKMYSPGQSKG